MNNAVTYVSRPCIPSSLSEVLRHPQRRLASNKDWEIESTRYSEMKYGPDDD